MLTDAAIRRAKPADKGYKLADAQGLHLFVAPSGARSFRFKYRFAGSEKLLTLGTYPDLSLADARAAAATARAQLREHRDPGVEKKRRAAAATAAAGRTLAELARAWHETQLARWSRHHAADVLDSLERDAFPKIGALPVAEIDVALIMSVLQPIERRGAIETAQRVRQRLEAVFAFAIAQGVASSNPAAAAKGALKPKPKGGRFPALTRVGDLRGLLAAIEGEAARCHPATKLAHRLLALSAVRPDNVNAAAWTEFEGIDFEAGTATEPLWRIPPERMKLGVDAKLESHFAHLVPLSPQAVDVLLAAHRLTGRYRYCFPSDRSTAKPMSENALSYAVRRAGYAGRHVPHGWRASFSSIMNERAAQAGRFEDRQIIDRQLGHKPEDKVEAAYNRAAFLPRRRELLEEWAGLIMEGAPPAVELLGARAWT